MLIPILEMKKLKHTEFKQLSQGHIIVSGRHEILTSALKLAPEFECLHVYTHTHIYVYTYIYVSDTFLKY